MEQNAPPSARAVFDQALVIATPAGRRAYLSQACGNDVGLRQKVDALLRAYQDSGSFLESGAPGLEFGAETLNESDLPPREGPGSLIGRYKLLQQIGEGGMGVVFLAEQTHPVRRQVALKVIKAGMDTRQVVARFEAERQALALMDHPNIAKVLDAGATDSGRPYFVMELVKGVPITKYCDEQRLTPRDRLGLFVQVCGAVQHAHTKGIIHRDLKPSNVMIALYDGKPVPKVIDFGIAKATGGRLTEATLFTGFGAVVGTPEYMSPEQAHLNQLDVDTRSDVYSLGVILYELLTGSTPLDRTQFNAAALLEVLRVVREQDPPTPSTRLGTTEGLAAIAACRGLEARKLSGVVRGELDWIVMKCLEKDRARRYDTANSLATDLRRYLGDEAVQARPTSAAYRASKFVRKHKAGAFAAAAVAAALVLGIIGTSAGLVRARAQTQRALQSETQAERQASRATALSDFMGRVLSSTKPGQDSRDVRVADLLAAAAADLDTRFHDQPDLELAARLSLRAAYDSLGMAEQSRHNLRRAHEASRLANGEDGRETLRLAADLARVLASSNDGAEAEILARAAYERAARVLGPSDHVTLSAGTALVDALGTLNQPVEAERLERQLIRDTPAPPDEFAHHRLWWLAQFVGRQGKNAESIRLLQQALDTARATGRADPAFRLNVIQPLTHSLVAEGRHDDAEREYAAIVSDPAMLAGQFSVGAMPQGGESVERGFSGVVHNYAVLLESRGNAGEATRVRSVHLAQLRAALPPPGADSASTLTRRANLLTRLGKFEDAAADYASAIDRNPGDHWPWCFRGCLLAYTDQPEAYRAHCRLMLQQFGTTNDRSVADRTAKTCMLVPGATPDLAQQLRLVNVVGAPGFDEGMLPWVRLLEGMAEYRQGHWEPAIVSLEQSRQVFYEGFDACKATVALLLAMAHHQLGRAEEAHALLVEARDVMERKLPKPGVGDLEPSGNEDWLICHVVRREAEALLAGGQAPVR